MTWDRSPAGQKQVAVRKGIGAFRQERTGLGPTDSALQYRIMKSMTSGRPDKFRQGISDENPQRGCMRTFANVSPGSSSSLPKEHTVPDRLIPWESRVPYEEYRAALNPVCLRIMYDAPR